LGHLPPNQGCTLGCRGGGGGGVKPSSTRKSQKVCPCSVRVSWATNVWCRQEHFFIQILQLGAGNGISEPQFWNLNYGSQLSWNWLAPQNGTCSAATGCRVQESRSQIVQISHPQQFIECAPLPRTHLNWLYSLRSHLAELARFSYIRPHSGEQVLDGNRLLM
jgi:hypothetical protein